MTVIVRMDTIVTTKSKTRIFLLKFLIYSYHRRIPICKFPTISCSRFSLIFYNSLNSLIFFLKDRIILYLRSFIIRRSSRHYDTSMWQFLETFFHLLEVLDAFLILLLTKFFRIITIIFIITGIIHTESHHQYSRIFAKNVTIQTFIHIIRCITTNTSIEYTNRHIREAGHVIQPDK